MAPERNKEKGRASAESQGALATSSQLSGPPIVTSRIAPKRKHNGGSSASSEASTGPNRPKKIQLNSSVFIEDDDVIQVAVAASRSAPKAVAPIQGVHICDMPYHNDRASAVAGYLNCPTIEALKELLNDSVMLNHLRELDDKSKHNYDAQKPQSTPFNVADMFLYSLDESITLRDIACIRPLDKYRFPISARGYAKRMYLFHLQFAWKVIRDFPEYFTGPFLKQLSRRYWDGLESEDIYRACTLFSFWQLLPTSVTFRPAAFDTDGGIELPLFSDGAQVVTGERRMQKAPTYTDVSDDRALVEQHAEDLIKGLTIDHPADMDKVISRTKAFLDPSFPGLSRHARERLLYSVDKVKDLCPNRTLIEPSFILSAEGHRGTVDAVRLQRYADEAGIFNLGSTIPRYQVITHELRQSSSEFAAYNAIIDEEADNLSSGVYADKWWEEFRSCRLNRRLILAAFNPLLDNFHRNRIAYNAAVLCRYAASENRIDSFTLFHMMTSGMPNVLPPSNRHERLAYLVGVSSKMQMICRLLNQMVVQQGQKVTIYGDHPSTLFCIELLLAIIDIRFVSVRPGQEENVRFTIDGYNNDPDIRVLVCSSRSPLNLQYEGHHIIICDPVPFDYIVQMICQSNRIEQKEVIQVHILTVDETIDAAIQSKAFLELQDQLKSISFLSNEVAEAIIGHLPSDMRRKMESKISAESNLTPSRWVKDYLQYNYACEITRGLLGIRSNRYKLWTNPYDSRAKNIYPEETIFRYGQGGIIADELYQLKTESIPRSKEGVSTFPREQMSAALSRMIPRKACDPVSPDNAASHIKAALKAIRARRTFDVSPRTSAEILMGYMEVWPDNDGLLKHALLKIQESDAGAPDADADGISHVCR